jgi:hypothetical protein
LTLAEVARSAGTIRQKRRRKAGRAWQIRQDFSVVFYNISSAVTNLLRTGHITQTCSQWFLARLCRPAFRWQVTSQFQSQGVVIMPVSNSMFAKLRTSAVGAAMVVTALPGLLQAQENDAATTTPIKHVIIVVGENHTFDNLFGAYSPQAGQHIDNLLSKGIVNSDGSPGPNFALARQNVGMDKGSYHTETPSVGTYATLPQPYTTVRHRLAARSAGCTLPDQPAERSVPDQQVRPYAAIYRRSGPSLLPDVAGRRWPARWTSSSGSKKPSAPVPTARRRRPAGSTRWRAQSRWVSTT